MAQKTPRLSREEIKKEILRCGRDPTYFITNYCYIYHSLRGLIRFKLYPFQETVIKDFNDHRFNIVLKARQLGVSTLVAAFSIWMMLFYRGKSVAVIATKEKKAVNVVKKAKVVYKHLPSWMKIAKMVTDNQNSFELDNGSWMKGEATSEDAGRSDSLSLLIIDEAAIIRDLEGLWPGLYSTVALGGKCIMISTPYGAQGQFYKMYTSAEAGDNDFHPSRYPWNVHPERDQAWFDKETRNMSKRAIAQELICSFNMSGETVFDSEKIDLIERNDISEPLYKTAFDRNLWIWEEYVPGNTYAIFADVSRGDSNDYSVAHVFKIGAITEIIAEYQGKATPDIFSNFLFNLGKQYGTCLVCVENNSVGYAVLDKLITNGYTNIYYSDKSSHDYVEQYEAEFRSGVLPGFSTTPKTKPLVIAKMEEMIRNRLLKFHSVRLLNECKTYVWNNSKAMSSPGYNDDLIMACAIGCFVRDLVFETNTRDLEYQKSFLMNMIRDTSTINTRISGMQGAPMNLALKDRMQQYKEYSWIFSDGYGRKK